MARNQNSISTPALASSEQPPSLAHKHRGPASRCIALGCAVVMAAVMAGCSSTKSPTSSATSAPTVSSSSSTTSAPTASSSSYPADKQELCQARDQLRGAVKSLTDPALLRQGTAAINAAVGQVQTDLQAVKTSAKQDYQPQIDALQTSLHGVQTAVGRLGSRSAGQKISALATAVASVGTDASALLTELKAACS